MKYERDFNNEKFPPTGIILLSEQKFVRTRNLMYKYQEVEFTDFSLVELALMSLAQWKRRSYTIPEGFKLHRNKILVKIAPDELLYNSILRGKRDLKSNTNVK
jgi:hypothetical protein